MSGFLGCMRGLESSIKASPQIIVSVLCVAMFKDKSHVLYPRAPVFKVTLERNASRKSRPYH